MKSRKLEKIMNYEIRITNCGLNFSHPVNFVDTPREGNEIAAPQKAARNKGEKFMTYSRKIIVGIIFLLVFVLFGGRETAFTYIKII